MRNHSLILVALMILNGVLILLTCSTPGNLQISTTLAKAGDIRGYVYTTLPEVEGDKNKQIFLPEVTVRITNAQGVEVDKQVTDIDGGYASRLLPAGGYKLCLERNGFKTTCYDIIVIEASNFPGPLEIPILTDDYVFGKVLLRDGRPGFYRSPVFNIDFHTEVSSNPGSSSQTVQCNVFGEYILPFVRKNQSKTLTATCQKAVVQQNISGRVNNMLLPNNSPAIRGITSFENNAPVRRTVDGQKLEVKASVDDIENHPLDYYWVAAGDFPGSSFSNSANVTWQLPNITARYQMYLLVNDQFGGVAYQNYNIKADAKRSVSFSGTVRTIQSQVAVANASVIMNGQTVANTDANGAFSFQVPETADERYILNISKLGFMLSSTVYFTDATSKNYTLVPSSVQTFDPTNPIELVEQQDKFTRFKRRRKGDKEEITRGPASVRIPANAIVDENGEAFSGTVSIGIRAVDLFAEQGLMPGDYGAIQNGDQKRIVSFGAVDIQIRDKNNPDRRLNIDRSTTAEIRIPIESAIQGNSPASIDLWDYNETSGLWENIGQLTRQDNFYVGKTDRFSTLNADVAFNDATCIQLLDNPANPVFPGQPVDVTITVPTGGAPKVLTYANLAQSDLPLIIVRLPPNANVTLEVRRNGTLLSTQIVPTRNAIPGAANLNPSPPYTYCNDAYILPPPTDDVINGFAPFLARVQTPNATEADKYYELIGAIGGADYNSDGFINNNDRISFDQWKQRHNFQTGDDFKALYFNAGDLAFWRAMHQKNHNGNIAYYVSNFTQDVDGIDDLNNPSNPLAIATVAMEYSKLQSGGTNPVTQFYVFNGAGQLINSADLDGYGPKFIPGLCIECHGGKELNYSSIANLQTQYDGAPTDNPRFLPFDVESFIFSNQTGFTQSDMESPLRSLNQRTLSTNATTAITEFVNASYNSFSSTTFNPNAVVSGWNTSASQNGVQIDDFYLEVVGTSCRTCHVSRTTNSSLQFNTFGDFNSSVFPGAVCGTGKYMPNAKVTFVNFWTSTLPHRPDLLNQFLGQTGPCQ